MNNNEKIKVYGPKYKEFPNDDEKGFILIDKNNSKNLLEFEKNFKNEKSIDDLIYIQKIAKNIVKEIFEIFPPEKLSICAKLLNFPEKIYKDEINKDNPKIYFENYNYVSMNFSGTLIYMDNLKLKGREIYQSNSIIGQEIAFNLGKLVYFLLNGVQYSTNSQMFKMNYPKVYQNFFYLTLKYYNFIKSPYDIKFIDFIKFDNENKEDSLKNNYNNEVSEMSSYNFIVNDSFNVESILRKNDFGNEITFLSHYGKGFIQTCFAVIPKKQRKKKNKDEFSEKKINEVIEKFNKKIDDINKDYLGV